MACSECACECVDDASSLDESRELVWMLSVGEDPAGYGLNCAIGDRVTGMCVYLVFAGGWRACVACEV